MNAVVKIKQLIVVGLLLVTLGSAVAPSAEADITSPRFAVGLRGGGKDGNETHGRSKDGNETHVRSKRLFQGIQR